MCNQEEHKFEYFWANSIYPSIEQCLEEAQSNYPSFLKDAKLEQKDLEKIKNDIERCYLSIRENMKKYNHIDGDGGCLNAPKLAAIICKSLIDNKIFTYTDEYLKKKFDCKGNELLDTLFINYKVALYSALNIMRADIITKCSYNIDNLNNEDSNYEELFTNNKEMIKKLDTNKSLKIYNYGSETYDSFKASIIKNLAYCDTCGLPFDFISFSIILEGLCEYNTLYFLGGFDKKGIPKLI